MFKFYTSISLFLLSMIGHAQTNLLLEWANKFNSGNISINDMVADNSGNVYIVGNFIGTFDLDFSQADVTITASYTADGFIVKYNELGEYQWSKQIGGIGFDSVNGVALSIAQDKVIITGEFEYTCNFDVTGQTPLELTTYDGFQTNSDAFIAGYDANLGNPSFYKKIGSDSNSETGTSITVASPTEFFVGVTFYASLQYDQAVSSNNIVASNQLVDHFFVGKYSLLDGTYAAHNFWIDDDQPMVLYDMVTAPGNNGVNIVGTFKETVDFDPTPATNNKTALGGNDIFLLNIPLFDGFGLGWITTFGSTDEFEQPLAMDQIQNLPSLIAVGGTFNGEMVFTTSNGTESIVSNGFTDGFVATFDAQGNLVRANQLGGASNDYEEISEVKFDSNSINAKLIVYGTLKGNIDTDITSGESIIQSSNGGQNLDLYIASYNTTDYSKVFANVLESTNAIVSSRVLARAGSNIYIGGYFFGELDADVSSAVSTLSAPSILEGFLIKYNVCQTPATPTTGSPLYYNVCQGNTVDLFVNDSGSPIQWELADGEIITNNTTGYTILGFQQNVLSINTTSFFFGEIEINAYANSCARSVEPLSFTVNIEDCFSIETLEEVETVVYPNPAKHDLTITSSEEIGTIKIFNMLGEQVQQAYGVSTQFTIDISQLETGVYLLSTEKGKTKFIKE